MVGSDELSAIVWKEKTPEGKSCTWQWNEINPQGHERRKASKACKTSRTQRMSNLGRFGVVQTLLVIDVAKRNIATPWKASSA
jgi:hypothetical protein